MTEKINKCGRVGKSFWIEGFQIIYSDTRCVRQGKTISLNGGCAHRLQPSKERGDRLGWDKLIGQKPEQNCYKSSDLSHVKSGDPSYDTVKMALHFCAPSPKFVTPESSLQTKETNPAPHLTRNSKGFQSKGWETVCRGVWVVFPFGILEQWKNIKGKLRKRELEWLTLCFNTLSYLNNIVYLNLDTFWTKPVECLIRCYFTSLTHSKKKKKATDADSETAGRFW